jgi:hypothetical protein
MVEAQQSAEVLRHTIGLGRLWWAGGRSLLRHSLLMERTKRSAYAFRLGLFAGRRMGVTPAEESRARNCGV